MGEGEVKRHNKYDERLKFHRVLINWHSVLYTKLKGVSIPSRKPSRKGNFSCLILQQPHFLYGIFFCNLNIFRQ